MTEVLEILEKLGLSCYGKSLLAQGFDTWDTLLHITESDLNDLNVKLGHRRKLQRAIAEHHRERGHSPGTTRPQDVVSVVTKSIETRPHVPHIKRQSSGPEENSVRVKRKYKRHPKPDTNAPERPPSAYVIFSNHMRAELKHHEYSFTQIAKIVGERWQELGADARDSYESEAATAKEKFNAAMSAYKKTEDHARYQEYLVAFKTKDGGGDQLDGKRAKVENANSVSTRDSVEDTSEVPRHNRRRSAASIYSAGSTPEEGNYEYPSAVSPSTWFFLGVQYQANRDHSMDIMSNGSNPTNLPTRNLPSPLDNRTLPRVDPPYTAYQRPRSPSNKTHPSTRYDNTKGVGYSAHPQLINQPQPCTSLPRTAFQEMLDADSPRSRRILPVPLPGVSVLPKIKTEHSLPPLPSTAWSTAERTEADVRGSLAALLRAGEMARDAENASMHERK